MKQIFTVILFLTIGYVAIAQQSYQDVVYLKNGSIIRGTIIEQVPNKSIKIETADRNVFVYQIDEIEKMSKEPIQNVDLSSKKSSQFKSGYLRLFETGYGFGIGDNKGNGFIKFHAINGYQFNPYFSLGFGTGLKYYIDAESLLIPLFVDLRAHFIDGTVSPYFALGIGYSLQVIPKFKGLGFLLNPSIGASFKLGSKVALNLGTGYSMQIAEGDNWGAICIDFGISF
ncbi:MAG: hypothetical protein WCI71_04605 [Bacteroidota bacterium]